MLIRLASCLHQDNIHPRNVSSTNDMLAIVFSHPNQDLRRARSASPIPSHPLLVTFALTEHKLQLEVPESIPGHSKTVSWHVCIQMTALSYAIKPMLGWKWDHSAQSISTILDHYHYHPMMRDCCRYMDRLSPCGGMESFDCIMKSLFSLTMLAGSSIVVNASNRAGAFGGINT